MLDVVRLPFKGKKCVLVVLTAVSVSGCMPTDGATEKPRAANANSSEPIKMPGFLGENSEPAAAKPEVVTVELTTPSKPPRAKPAKPPRAEKSVPKAVGTAARDIEKREAAYAKVMADARMRGMLGGAVQGAVIGMLVESSGAGVVAGAVIGGAVGSAIGDSVGANVVQKHRNFLVREASLQRVIRAAKQDTANTSFDLLLSSELVQATRSARSPDRAEVAKSKVRLEKFRELAATRTVALREVLPLYDDVPETRSQLVAELEKQLTAIAKLDKNIRLLGSEGE